MQGDHLLPEVIKEMSYSKEPDNIKVETPPVLEVDVSNSKIEEHQPLPRYPCPEKPKVVDEEIQLIGGSKNKPVEDQELLELEKLPR